jgi:adenylate kinase family enzyme
VLGGPGSGKGTQCAKLVRDRAYVHLSAGDLLRDEVQSGSALGQECHAIMKEGKLVPQEVIIRLLREAMERAVAAAESAGGALPVNVLIDGFPRALDQAGMFERLICAPELVLFFDCPEDVMEARLLKRGESSGRADDNAETIRKRFHTFVQQSLPVVAAYERRGLAARVSATAPPDEVYAEVLKAIDAKSAAASGKRAAAGVSGGSGGRKAAAGGGGKAVVVANAVPMVAAA